MKLRFPVLRFRLRTLLLVMSVFAFLLAFWTSKYREFNQKLRRIAMVGGRPYSDVQCNLNGIPMVMTETKGIWSRRESEVLLSPFRRLVAVEFHSTQVTDSDLACLHGLEKELLYLDLRDTRISDRGLCYLRKFEELNAVFLSGTMVTREGLRQFRSQCPKIETIVCDFDFAENLELINEFIDERSE